jgi:hypothetical protein
MPLIFWLAALACHLTSCRKQLADDILCVPVSPDLEGLCKDRDKGRGKRLYILMVLQVDSL